MLILKQEDVKTVQMGALNVLVLKFVIFVNHMNGITIVCIKILVFNFALVIC